MIDYVKSAELNGMGVEELKVWFDKYPQSNKRIIRICDNCRKENEMSFQGYSLLCQKCFSNTPESRLANSKGQIKRWSNQNNRDEQAKRTSEYAKSHPDCMIEHGKKMVQYYIDNPEARNKMSESILQYHIDHPEAAELARLKSIERWSDPEECRNQSIRLLQYYIDYPEVITEMSERMIQYNKNHPEKGKNHSEWMIQYFIDNPEISKNHSEFMIKYCNTPKIIKKVSKHWLAYYSIQTNRDEHSDKLKKYNEDPKVRKENSERLKKYNEDPEVRKIRSYKLKQYHIDHPEMAERMSARMQGIPYEKWEGFVGDNEWRDWNKAIYLNEPFPGCHRHHITKTIVVCIPGELHGHIWHNLRTGLNMGEINLLALQFINGGL